MSISTRNKKDILNEIIQMQYGIELEKDVREVVRAFAHHKQVNKRFTDAIEAKGYHSYIIKDSYSSKLVVRKRIDSTTYTGENRSIEFYVYASHGFNSTPFTWERILEEFKKYKYVERLEELKVMLSTIDQDVEELKKLATCMDSIKLSCFDLWRMKSDLKEAIRYAST
jgi:hypothetical protein